MFNWDDKNFYKLLIENYHEEEFRSCDIRDCVEYQQTMREIRKLQKQMMEKYPDALDDLNELGDLYRSINEVKDHYFFEEGVMFALNMMMPRMITREFFQTDKKVSERLTKVTCKEEPEDFDEEDDGYDDEEGEDEEDE